MPQNHPSQTSTAIPTTVAWEELTDVNAASLLALAVFPEQEAEKSTTPEIPGYTVIEWIGNGGMGSVYRAVQESLGREVALKIISPALAAEPTFAARFEREARSLARLSHPNIVTIHDSGTTPDGRMFLAMEWVQGRDLATRLKEQGTLDPAEALGLIRQLCEALHAAHELGIIHRDVKPSNILLTRDGQVKLADFGIALPVGASTIALTLTGTSLGTPDYLAPEAFSPGFQPDARSDIFSAGVTFYQSLTGKIPRGRFSPPSQLIRNINPRVDSIIDTALHQDPSRRFASARAMAEAIAGVESSRPGLPGMRVFLVLAVLAVLALLAILPIIHRNMIIPQPAAPATEASPVLGNPHHPPGQWIAAFQSARAVESLSSGVRWNDGWITPDPAAGEALCLYPSPAPTGANWGARAVYRWKSAEHARAAVTLRKRYHPADGRSLSEHYLFEVYSREAGFSRNRQTVAAHNVATPIGRTLTLDLKDGQEVAVEAFVIDGTLYGKVNGVLIETSTDGVLSRGEFDLATYGMAFRDLAFINLDGLSTGEALRAAGILPQWQKFEFAALDPAESTQGRAGLSMSDGLLRIRDWDRWHLQTTGSHAFETKRNAALRVAVQIRHDSHPKITVRLQPDMVRQYSADLFHDGVFVTHQSGPGRSNLRYLRKFPLPRVLSEGDIGSFQFACVGRAFYVWSEGQLLGKVEDDALSQPGGLGLQASNGSFATLEYLPLDHLSESEALKLLDVDSP